MSNAFDLKTQLIEEKKIEQQMEKHRLRDAFLRDLLQNNHFYVFLITGFVTLSAVIVSCTSKDMEFIKEFWKIVIPIITAYMGYAIGDRKGKK